MTAVSSPARRAYSTSKVAIGFGDSGSVHGAVGVYDAATGKRLWRWETGAGGGAVWNAITYDPEANRLYVGTGNARGADAAANRFACSVVALNADSGELAWNYDTAPGDHLQCDASTDITLATINIDGQPRKVILHAPKDGTFHVLDRATGKLIGSKKLGLGAHNHFAQSFNPKTGLVYLPTTELPDSNPDGDAPANSGRSALVAWDPAKQRAAWAIPTQGAYSGGVLSTAGDLVFQGQADGYITAYSAVEGRRVWAFYSATAALGAPISFADRQTPIHFDPQRADAGRGRKPRRDVREIRLGLACASTPPPDLRARWHGPIAADSRADVCRSDRRNRSERGRGARQRGRAGVCEMSVVSWCRRDRRRRGSRSARLVVAAGSRVVRGGGARRAGDAGHAEVRGAHRSRARCVAELHSSTGTGRNAAQRGRATRARSAAGCRDCASRRAERAAACARIIGTRGPAAETVAPRSRKKLIGQ